MQSFLIDLIQDLKALDSQLVFLVIIIASAIMVLDAVSIYTRRRRKEIGVRPKTSAVSIDGSKTLPVRSYLSEMQGLAGRPDALISENGNIIPVERKPLARKLRDRHIAQLLVYMRLVEEFEGKRPPYGYLILGPNCRSYRIENSPERQAWLQKIIDEMRAIFEGAKAQALPQTKKCKKCSVNQFCEFRCDAPTTNAATKPGLKILVG